MPLFVTLGPKCHLQRCGEVHGTLYMLALDSLSLLFCGGIWGSRLPVLVFSKQLGSCRAAPASPSSCAGTHQCGLLRGLPSLPDTRYLDTNLKATLRPSQVLRTLLNSFHTPLLPESHHSPGDESPDKVARLESHGSERGVTSL